MRHIRFLQLDVFTSAPFGGNQLAVFLDATNITSEEMQAIAREMNFSESVFVLPSAEPQALARIRIFTPQIELPFAGHPVIGTTFALAEAGSIRTSSVSPITLEAGIGPLAIELLFADGRLSFAWMRQPIPVFQVWTGDRETLAAAIGLSPAELRTDLPIERASSGVPFVLIPIASEQALDRAQPSGTLADALNDTERHTGAYLFTAPSESGDQPVSARMFASGMGIVEDAATGSAAGPLGAYLLRHDLARVNDGEARITIAQGVRMKRPSRLEVAIAQDEGAITRVRVGGESVVVAQGEFLLPDALTLR